ncbi:hypothetical protein L3Q82_006855 [Scortum barcoo]|uniref:Uncharacterized protein n=1 Tax=Scortum barcoo TaxID=214431 RepID=A0ACB8WW42_9TELE|nr:hypothetical protein L3Q82_006855 [Scortum barcoo]
MAAELGSYKQAHTSPPPLTLGNSRVVEGPAPLKELGSRAQAMRGEFWSRDWVVEAPATTATQTTLHRPLMDLPAGGEPTGRRTHVAIFGLSPAGSCGQRPGHQVLSPASPNPRTDREKEIIPQLQEAYHRGGMTWTAGYRPENEPNMRQTNASVLPNYGLEPRYCQRKKAKSRKVVKLHCTYWQCHQKGTEEEWIVTPPACAAMYSLAQTSTVCLVRRTSYTVQKLKRDGPVTRTIQQQWSDQSDSDSALRDCFSTTEWCVFKDTDINTYTDAVIGYNRKMHQ